MTHTINTMFSGGELVGIGARQAGYQHGWGIEYRADIAAVARLNGFDVRCDDVRSVDYSAMRAATHLHASPSCKTASQANNNGGETAFDLECGDAIARAIAAHAAAGGETFTLENVWAYRNYVAFQRILAALTGAGFGYRFDHVNMADYGVPQTRKRLILMAARSKTPPAMMPTHSKHGDMFTAPWQSWYSAVADLLPTMPSDAFAPWQLERLPAYVDTTVLFTGIRQMSRPITTRAIHEPAPTIDAATAPTKHPYALLIGDQHRQSASNAPVRAFVVDGQASRYGEKLTLRNGTQPMYTLTSTMERRPARAYLSEGRVVRMDIRALARVQTVPDGYIGLTPDINGNGVPCLFARQLMQHMRESTR